MNTIEKSIESVNKKPIQARRQTAMFIVTSLTAIIFVVWLSTLSLGNNSRVKEQSEDTASPFAILKDNVVTLYASASDGLREAKNQNK